MKAARDDMTATRRWRAAAAGLATGLTVALAPFAVAATSLAALESGDGSALFGVVERRALHYEFTVNGETVGTAEGEIVKTGANAWRVEATYDIDVDAFGLPLYSLEMTARERYRGTRLVALEARTVENGERHRVEGEAEDGRFVYAYNGERAGKAPPEIVPSTQLWRHDMLERQRVLHAIEGKELQREVEPLGEKTFDTPRGRQTLRGVHVEGPDESGKLWYNDEGLLERAVLHRMGVKLVIHRRAAE